MKKIKTYKGPDIIWTPGEVKRMVKDWGYGDTILRLTGDTFNMMYIEKMVREFGDKKYMKELRKQKNKS